ncbi:alpha/beta hydrolase family protein [Sporosarcina thermotolerans]|uniref:alpha/beta hydrolase family protein n=1 Tax=Sporosarcina thermotolerans TaxID=633404 RepID=UPI00321913E9
MPPWWEAARELLYKKIGDPYEQTEYIRSISPLFHAEKINKPLIVLQGANDPRVLQVESDDIVEKVKENGVPVEYIIFEDEGHGFTKRENQIKGYRAIREFLDTYL